MCKLYNALAYTSLLFFPLRKWNFYSASSARDTAFKAFSHAQVPRLQRGPSSTQSTQRVNVFLSLAEPAENAEKDEKDEIYLWPEF